MRKFIIALALLFALPVYAAEPVVCAPDTRACKPPAVKVNGRCTIIKEVPAPCPPVPAPVVVTKEVIKEVPGPVVTKTYPVEVIKLVELESPWENMVFARFGAHWNTNGYPSTLQTQDTLNAYPFANWGSWDVGTEFHYKPARMGLRSSVGNNGISGIVQVFPVQGRLNWYIGAGAAYTQYPFYRPTVPNIQRYWDIQAATGVEYAFTKNIIGLADVRASVPVPWTNTNSLTWNDFGSAMGQTAVMVGVGYRF
jgi:hypothetical protein